MKHTILFLGLFVSVYGFSLTGQEVLDKIEANLTGARDQTALLELSLGRIGSPPRETRTMRLWSAGTDKRVVRFLTPTSVRNVSLLVRGADEMYIYLPAFRRIRRIQGDMQNENFQGTDFSYREIGSFEYSEDYTTTIQTQTDNEIVLELTRKPDSDAPHSRIVMTVDRTVFLPKKLEMFDGNTLHKVLTILERERKEHWVLSRIRMEDRRRNHYTEILMRDVVFNSGLERQNIFTERFLRAE